MKEKRKASRDFNVSIAPLVTVVFLLFLTATAFAVEGSAVMTTDYIETEYKNGDGVHYSELSSSMEVKDVADVKLILVNAPEFVYKGDVAKIEFDVANGMAKDIKAVSVMPAIDKGDGGVRILPSENFIGDMEAGDVFSASFELYTYNLSVGDTEIPFKLVFRDVDTDKRYEIPGYDVHIEVREPQESELPNLLRFGALLVIQLKDSNEKMSEEAMQEVLDSFAEEGKQCGLGESAGRIWGFLLLKSCPVTQKEIEEGTGLSSRLISQFLRGMEKRTAVEVKRDGREKRYSINSSLAASFWELVGLQEEDNTKPLIEHPSGLSDKIKDQKLRKSLLSIIGEYKKLRIAFILFPQKIELINGMNIIDVKDIEEVAKSISIIIDGMGREK